MRKQVRRIAFLAAIVLCVWFGGVLADSARLREDILRLHVVAASDSQEDQAVKFRVRDAILGSLEDGLEDLTDMDQAIAYVQDMLPRLQTVANRVLQEAGVAETATVSLANEEFPIREYDTFTLPSGVYPSLRVTIGEGEGHNWWCVVFPQLCVPATAEEFQEAAAMEDLPETLTGALTGEYEIRFWLLDQLGRLQNFLHSASE